ncbi:MAG: prephenate dehydrogenase/arogenate dehydrogenase family protein [Methylocystaceae bacterium]
MLTAGIIGLGLIGGSLALAFKTNCADQYWTAGLDIDPVTMQRAQEMGIIDHIIENWDVSACDIIFICSPLPTIPDMLARIRPTLKPGTVVTDVGSVKSPVMRWFTELLPAGVAGIGGHPMAGSDKSGITAADGHLFENAVWVLTPPEEGTSHELAKLAQLLTCTGAAIRVMPADKHDEAVSLVSHLPHITAVSLVNALPTGDDFLSLAGGGLRDTTRIASSDPELWADILLNNRQLIINGIDTLVEKLSEMRHTLSSSNRENLVGQLCSARETRGRIPQRRESLLLSVDIIAIVPDQPGIIGKLGLLLGNAGVNINDMQVLGVRDENEGSLRLAIPEKQAEDALHLLKDAGIRAWIRD